MERRVVHAPLTRDESPWLARLHADGIVERTPGGVVLTRRWHGMFARAALDQFEAGQTLTDLRTPIAVAFVCAYPDDSDDSIVEAIAVMYPIVSAALDA